jgi:hypothetical protein
VKSWWRSLLGLKTADQVTSEVMARSIQLGLPARFVATRESLAEYTALVATFAQNEGVPANGLQSCLAKFTPAP